VKVRSRVSVSITAPDIRRRVGLAAAVGLRPAVVRDHRSTGGPVVRDHRSTGGPDVRDNRTRGPVVRDHRTGGPVVRDHRGDGPVVRDHRGDPPVVRDHRGDVVQRALSVSVNKVADDGAREPMDVLVRISVQGLEQRTRHVVTLPPGAGTTLELPAGPYRVSATCDVYDADGASVQTVDLSADRSVEFGFRPRTILEGDETYLVGFVCRRLPLCPDPHPDARW
jgi:hypothetical protein